MLAALAVAASVLIILHTLLIRVPFGLTVLGRLQEAASATYSTNTELTHLARLPREWTSASGYYLDISEETIMLSYRPSEGMWCCFDAGSAA